MELRWQCTGTVTARAGREESAAGNSAAPGVAEQQHALQQMLRGNSSGFRRCSAPADARSSSCLGHVAAAVHGMRWTMLSLPQSCRLRQLYGANTVLVGACYCCRTPRSLLTVPSTASAQTMRIARSPSTAHRCGSSNQCTASVITQQP